MAQIQRDDLIKSTRIDLNLKVIAGSISPEEAFQNTTLRPVIKWQHALIIESFKLQINRYCKDYGNYSQEKREQFIDNTFNKNTGFKNFVHGLIVGQFTSVESEEYFTNSKAIDRRITGIVRQRIFDSMKELCN